jgi:hypothetical protein
MMFSQKILRNVGPTLLNPKYMHVLWSGNPYKLLQTRTGICKLTLAVVPVVLPRRSVNPSLRPAVVWSRLTRGDGQKDWLTSFCTFALCQATVTQGVGTQEFRIEPRYSINRPVTMYAHQ